MLPFTIFSSYAPSPARANAPPSVASLRKNIAFIALFGFLTLTFMMLGAGAFTGNTHLNKAGGALGIITALIAYYVGTSELLASGDSILRLPLGQFKQRVD